MLWRNFVHRTCVLDDWGLLVLMLMIWSGCLHATLLLIGWCPFLRGRLPVCGAAGVSLLLYMDVVRLYLGLKRGAFLQAMHRWFVWLKPVSSRVLKQKRNNRLTFVCQSL